MTLDEKCSLTAGASLWYLPPVERLGLPALKVSDGPSGVRGDSLIGRRSLSLPCGTRDRVDLEPVAGGPPGRSPGRRGAVQGSPRAARTDGLHRAHSPGRARLRVVLRGPAADGSPRRRLRGGRAAGWCRVLHQALRLQRPGARADDDQRRGPRACPARDPPPGLRGGRAGGRRVVGHDGLQQGRRHLLRRAARPHRGDPAGRVGVRRRRHVGLVRHALDGAGGGRRPRPRDAGPAGLARPVSGGRGPRRDGRHDGGGPAGAPPPAPDGAGGAAATEPPPAQRRRNSRRTTRAGGRWPARWRPRARCCWSTTACCPSRARCPAWPSSARTRASSRWAGAAPR